MMLGLLLVFLLILVPLNGQQVIQPNDFFNGMMNGTFDLIMDVRTKAEWDGGHIENATFVESLASSSAIPTAIRGCEGECQNIVVYCRSGNRAGAAIDLMLENGFTGTIYNGRGTSQWTNAGYILVNSSSLAAPCSNLGGTNTCDETTIGGPPSGTPQPTLAPTAAPTETPTPPPVTVAPATPSPTTAPPVTASPTPEPTPLPSIAPSPPTSSTVTAPPTQTAATPAPTVPPPVTAFPTLFPTTAMSTTLAPTTLAPITESPTVSTTAPSTASLSPTSTSAAPSLRASESPSKSTAPSIRLPPSAAPSNASLEPSATPSTHSVAAPSSDAPTFSSNNSAANSTAVPSPLPFGQTATALEGGNSGVAAVVANSWVNIVVCAGCLFWVVWN